MAEEQAKKGLNLKIIKKLLVSKCIHDPSFKEKFLKNPREVIKQEYKIQLPEGVRINVHEDTEQTFNVVLPSKSEIESYHDKDYALSDEELQAISGGVAPGERYDWFERAAQEEAYRSGKTKTPPPTMSA